VPDWPLSFGQFFPPMVGGVLFEHGHRMIAATIGLLTVILAAWLWRGQPRRTLRIAGLWAIGAVLTQGLLGGITVLLRLPALVSIAHACLGQLFFSLMLCIAVLTAPGAFDEARVPSIGAARLQRLAVWTTAFVLMQLVLGAMLRHSAVNVLHFHMLGALIVAVHILLVARRILPERSFGPELRYPAAMLLVLLAVQVMLGLVTWRAPDVGVATAHVATGALILATSSLLALQSFRRLVPA
jgi:cytochrome c oxidase assembly protein subunit 15